MLSWLLARLYDWLSPSDPLCYGDLIFALAGRQSRKLYALELFRQGMGKSLLLSVGQHEISNFAQLSWPAEIDLAPTAAPPGASQRHYFVSLEAGSSNVDLVPIGRLGTLSEIRALARWLQTRPHIASLLIVSSAPHLRRVRASCRALLPGCLQPRFLPAPNDGSLNPTSWWRNRHSRALVLKETGKLFIYRLLLIRAAKRL